MKASIEQVDSLHEAHIYEAKLSDLREVESFCKKQSDVQKAGTDFKHAATVPAWVIQKFCNERGVTFKELMRSSLMTNYFLDSEYCAPWRIWKGKI